VENLQRMEETKKMKKQFSSFEEARKFVHNLNLKNTAEWYEYCKSGKKPNDMPANPPQVYKKEWKGYGDWLGTFRVANQDRNFRSFEDARSFVHSLKLESFRDWSTYYKSGKKPNDIPTHPDTVYEKQWQGWIDWLGSIHHSGRYKKMLSFTDARRFVQRLKLKSETDWRKYKTSGNLPYFIPSVPDKKYKKEWKGYGDWLGTLVEGSKYGKFREFEQARKFVHSLHITGYSNGWHNYCRQGSKPDDIPSHPEKVYKEEWNDWDDWTGIPKRVKIKKETSTQTNSVSLMIYSSFEEARKFVHNLNLKNTAEWYEYCKSGKKPNDMPANPPQVYKKEWKGYGDWLGTFRVANQDRKYRPFKEAREFVRSLGLKSYQEWLNYCKSGKKPDDIPAHPWDVYKEWKKPRK